ncbi:MAG: S-methyl-5-thioribose-1-phosphate isomerase [Candidatus Aenigmatarchaeota archaeon]
MPESLSSLEKRIKSLEIQGAKDIAIESLVFLRKLVKKKGFGREFTRAAKMIERVRPTAVVLHNCLEIIRKDKDVKTINSLLRQMSNSKKEIAKRGSRLIKKNSKIMTRCHSTEALAVIKQAWKDGKKVTVYATETRPKWQGVKTAKELSKLGIPVILIVDSAMAFFIDDVDMVIVGTDAIRKEGIVNKIGTYPLALVAQKHKKPFYVAGNTLKLDKRKKLLIEERDPDEVYTERTKTLEVRNPAFDLTPWKYVKRVVTEKGVMTPSNIKKMLK